MNISKVLTLWSVFAIKKTQIGGRFLLGIITFTILSTSFAGEKMSCSGVLTKISDKFVSDLLGETKISKSDAQSLRELLVSYRSFLMTNTSGNKNIEVMIRGFLISVGIEPKKIDELFLNVKQSLLNSVEDSKKDEAQDEYKPNTKLSWEHQKDFGFHRSIDMIKFSPDGTKLITSSRDHFVRVWNVKSGKVLKKFEGLQNVFMSSFVFSSDGEKLYFASQDGLSAWNFKLKTLEVIEDKRRRQVGTALDLALSPDENFLYEANSNENILEWDLKKENG